MVGAIPGDVVMHERPVGRGYVNLEETAAFPWPRVAGRRAHGARARIPLLEPREPARRSALCAYAVKRGHGIDGRRDGIVVNNVLASYAHLRSAGGNAWAARFVDFVRHTDYRRSRQDNIVYLPPARGREAMVV